MTTESKAAIKIASFGKILTATARVLVPHLKWMSTAQRMLRVATIFGGIADLKKTVDTALNKFDDVDPDFDESFVPRSIKHQMVGYRPTGYQK